MAAHWVSSTRRIGLCTIRGFAHQAHLHDVPKTSLNSSVQLIIRPTLFGSPDLTWRMPGPLVIIVGFMHDQLHSLSRPNLSSGLRDVDTCEYSGMFPLVYAVMMSARPNGAAKSTTRIPTSRMRGRVDLMSMEGETCVHIWSGGKTM